MDKKTFREGIYQVFVQPEELAMKMFNTIDTDCSGFIDWSEFLEAMRMIQGAKTVANKIDLFIKICNEDQNGMLNAQEIYDLCKICLSRFIESGGGTLEMLSRYFTKLVFQILKTNMKDEIPMEKVKKKILRDSEDSELLKMFCGADI